MTSMPKGKAKSGRKPAAKSGREKQLSAPKRDHACLLYANGMNAIEIAQQLKVRPVSVRNWLGNEQAKAEIARIREARLERQRAKLEFLADPALAALAQTLSGEVESKVRLAAIDSVLDRIGIARNIKTESNANITQAHHAKDAFSGWTDEQLRHFVSTGERPE